MLARTLAASTTAVRGLRHSGGRQCARAMGVAARFDRPGNPLHVVKCAAAAAFPREYRAPRA